jgi:hypothetical protein
MAFLSGGHPSPVGTVNSVQTRKASPDTKGLDVTLIDQGVNGGTVTDLVRGFSPWGHLDPHQPQSNITFEQTILRDKPDVCSSFLGRIFHRRGCLLLNPTIVGPNLSQHTCDLTACLSVDHVLQMLLQ